MEVVLREMKRHSPDMMVDDFYEMVCCYLYRTKIWGLLPPSQKRGFMKPGGIDGWDEESKTAITFQPKKLDNFHEMATKFGAFHRILIHKPKKLHHPDSRLTAIGKFPEALCKEIFSRFEVDEIAPVSNFMLTHYPLIVEKALESWNNPVNIKMTPKDNSFLILELVNRIVGKKAIVLSSQEAVSEITTLLGSDRVGQTDLVKEIFICIDSSSERILHYHFDAIIFSETSKTFKEIKNSLDPRIRIFCIDSMLRKNIELDYNSKWQIDHQYLNDYTVEIVYGEAMSRYSEIITNIKKRPEWLRILGFCNPENLHHVKSLLDKSGLKCDVYRNGKQSMIEAFRQFELKILLCLGDEKVDIPETCTCIFFDGITNPHRDIVHFRTILSKNLVKDRSFLVLPLASKPELKMTEFFKILRRSEGCMDITKFMEKFSFSTGPENEYLNDFSQKFFDELFNLKKFDFYHEQVGVFVLENRRIPTRTSNDQYEKKLARWYHKNKKFEKIGKFLLDLEFFEKKWYEYAEYYSKYGNVDQDWLVEQYKMAQANLLSKEQISFLAEKLPVPSLRPKVSDSWKEQADACAMFFQENNRFPSCTIFDENERKLGIWFSNQRLDFTLERLPKERIEYLTEKIPGWEPKKTTILLKDFYTRQELENFTRAKMITILKSKNIQYKTEWNKSCYIDTILELYNKT